MGYSARLPAAPLQRILTRTRLTFGLCWEELAARLGMSSRTLSRVMSARTLSPFVADRLAIRLGSHPALIWPDEWARPAGARKQTTTRRQRMSA